MSLLDVEEPVNVSGRKLVIEGYRLLYAVLEVAACCCGLMEWAIEKCYSCSYCGRTDNGGGRRRAQYCHRVYRLHTTQYIY